MYDSRYPSDLLLGQKNEGRGKVKEAERVEKWMKTSESERRGEGKEKGEARTEEEYTYFKCHEELKRNLERFVK